MAKYPTAHMTPRERLTYHVNAAIARGEKPIVEVPANPKTEIKTVRHLRAALAAAKIVMVQPRFGASEAWVAITKKEAKEFVANLDKDATPEGCEMYAGYFGVLEGTVLYLG